MEFINEAHQLFLWKQIVPDWHLFDTDPVLFFNE